MHCFVANAGSQCASVKNCFTIACTTKGEKEGFHVLDRMAKAIVKGKAEGMTLRKVVNLTLTLILTLILTLTQGHI